MPAHLHLSDVFGNLGNAWPFQLVRGAPGLAGPGSMEDVAWLDEIDASVHLHDVRSSVLDSVVAVEAMVSVSATRSPEGLPFHFAAMPDFEFRVLDLNEPSVRLYAALSAAGVELLLEGVPVELRLPRDFIGPLRSETFRDAGELSSGSLPFAAGVVDSQQAILAPHGPTRVRTHMRIHVTTDLEVSIASVLPISFGACELMSLPCRAVHGLELLPSARREPQTREWIRHSVGWNVVDGAVGIRMADLDLSQPPFRDARSHAEQEERVEWVLEDVVVGIPAYTILPLPAHFTFGARRNMEAIDDPVDLYTFSRAPLRIPFGDQRGSAGTYLAIHRLLARTSSTGVDLQVDAGLSLGSGDLRNWSLTFGADENLTFRIGLAREPRNDDAANIALRISLSDWVVVDLVALTVGFSFGRLSDFPVEKSFEATGDFWLHEPGAHPPPRPGESPPPPSNVRAARRNGLRIETTSGQPLSIVLQGLGYKYGAFTFGDAISLPDGARIMLGPVGLIVFDLGSTEEDGATYFSISGGLLVELDAVEVASWFRRLRFRIAGEPTAAPFKMDGFGLMVRIPDLLKLEVLGYYSDEILRPDAAPALRRCEFGLTGSLELELGAQKWLFMLDLIVGNLSGLDPAEGVRAFDYMMIQVVVECQVTLGSVQLLGCRVLFSRNMLPSIDDNDASAGPLRYYCWARRFDPLTVPGDRRLAAWRPQDNATAVGLGFSISFAGMGEVFRLQAFGLYLDAPEERGLLIALELFLMKSRRPCAWAVLEYDFRNDRFALLLGVDLTLNHLIENAPREIADVIRIRGTLFIGNKPGTFALGRLDDQQSWLTLLFELNLAGVVRIYITVALCIEMVEGGPEGFALVFRIEGGVDLGFIAIEAYAGIRLLIRSLDTGSGDFAVVAGAELGLAITLLRFIRFGLGVAGDIHHVAHEPTYTLYRLVVTIETPWFLPDISWTIECIEGSISPPLRAMATAPLLQAAASHEATGASAVVHVERLADEALRLRAPSADPPPAAGPVLSLEELASLALPEADRLARFAADNAAVPLATDATLSIVFSALVEDALGIGGTDAALGTQTSGDESASLAVRYRLVGLTVRRRRRHGSVRSWSPVEERRELQLELDDGVLAVSGVLEPEQLTMAWDVNTQVAGAVAAKRLLINASTPFELGLRDAVEDEALLNGNPAWPCCAVQAPLLHVFDFRTEPAGPLATLRRRVFKGTGSTVWPRAEARIGLAALAAGTSTADASLHVAAFDVGEPGMVLRVAFDEAVLCVDVRLAGFGTIAFDVEPVLRDAEGRPIPARGPERLAGLHGWRTVALVGRRPFRSFELRVKDGHVLGQPPLPRSAEPVLLVDRLSYVGWAAYRRWWREERHSARRAAEPGALAGQGKLFFLPNHEYELAVTVDVAVRHSSTEWQASETTEYVQFSTKGLPGLNAVQHVGAELHPYIRSAYGGGRGLLYREEPVALQFDEDYSVLLPLERRPSGGTEERTQLLQLALTAQPERPAEPQQAVSTATGADWIVAHRRVPLLGAAALPWQSTSALLVVPAISTDAARERLAALTQRPGAYCAMPDPREVERAVLVARAPAAEGVLREERLWPPSTSYQATVRPARSPFVHRPSFESADLSALAFPGVAGLDNAAGWAVSDGALCPAAGQRLAQFGEPSWNHLRVSVALELAEGAFAIGVGMPAGRLEGLFARVERGVDGIALSLRSDIDGPPLADTLVTATGHAVSLVVTAFDDVVRVELGETSLEVPRGEVRDGLIGLVADGELQLRSLFVNGLAMYEYGFRTSRYSSFAEHIDAFESTVAVIEADDLGADARSASVAALRAESGARRQEAMRPESPASMREALFVEWASLLALPLAHSLEAPRLSEVRGDVGVEAILLESPEPLDFVEEITTALTRRLQVTIPGAAMEVPTWLTGLLGDLEQVGVLPRVSLSASDQSLGDTAIHRALAAAGLPAPPLPGPVRWVMRPAPASLPPIALPPRVQPQHLVAHGAPVATWKERVVQRIPPPKRPQQGMAREQVRMLRSQGAVVLQLPRDRSLMRNPRAVAVVTVEPMGHDSLQVRVLQGQTQADANTVYARLAGDASSRIAWRAGAPSQGQDALAIALDLVDRQVLGIVPWEPRGRPNTEWRDVPIDILQNGNATKALILPRTGAFRPGNYRLSLRMHRKRYEVRMPVDDLAAYRAERELSFAL